MRLGAGYCLSEAKIRTTNKLYIAQADIVDCFYECGIDDELGEWFGFDSLSGAELRSLGITSIDGIDIADDDHWFPCMTVMPRGFSHAFWFVQAAHVQILRDIGFPEGDI